jgi:hypothetical protein
MADHPAQGGVVGEPLVAWAEDCIVRGDVALEEGRLSDVVNGLDFVTFTSATLEALADGRRVDVPELEVERRDLHLIEVNGRRGDPSRRLRTVEERVVLEVGPYVVTGNLHRPPNTHSMAALGRWATFVPVTDAAFRLGPDAPEHHHDVLLVNRERIAKSEALFHVSVESAPAEGASPA